MPLVFQGHTINHVQPCKHCLYILVLDLYADTPPLETLMEVPLDVRRKQLFKVRPNHILFEISEKIGLEQF